MERDSEDGRPSPQCIKCKLGGVLARGNGQFDVKYNLFLVLFPFRHMIDVAVAARWYHNT